MKLNRHLRLRAPLLMGTLLLGLVPMGGPAGASGAAPPVPGRVIIVTIPRLTWGEIDPQSTPNLYQFFRHSAVGDLSLRTISPRTSLSEAYLTIGAGNRASARDSDGGRMLAGSDVYENGTAAQVYRRRTGWPADGELLQLSIPVILAQNARYLFGAEPGRLGQTLRDAGHTPVVVANADLEVTPDGTLDTGQTASPTGSGVTPQEPVIPRGPTTAVLSSVEPTGGENRPAGLALMDVRGVVQSGSVSRRLLQSDPNSPFGVHMRQARVVSELSKRLKANSVALVELSDLDRADLYQSRASTAQSSTLVTNSIKASDTLFGSIARLFRPTDLVMVLSPAAPRAGETLTPIGIRGAGIESGELVSGTTRRGGYVTLSDIAPTILERLHLPKPSSMTGAPISASNSANLGATRWHQFVRLNKATAFRDRISGSMTALFVILQVIFCGMAIMALAFSTPRVRTPSALLALFTMSIPAVSFLLGLLPSPDPGYWPYLGLLTLGAAAMALFSHLLGSRFGPERRVQVAAMTPALVVFILLVIDITTGGRLQINTVFGYSPVVAGRFAGFGNPAYSIFSMSALVLCCGLWTIFKGDEPGRHRRVLTVGVSLVFLVAVVLDGYPSFGSDVGGTLSIIPTAFLVVWLLLGRRVRVRMVAIATGVTLGALAVFAAIDLSRPVDQQTHLGRLVHQVSGSGGGGGSGGLLLVLQRKLNTNLSVLTNSIWTWTIPLALVLIVRFTRRRPRVVQDRLPDSPATKACLWGGITLCVLGMAVNDSGISIPAVMFMVFLPYVVYLTVAPRSPNDPLPGRVQEISTGSIESEPVLAPSVAP